MRPLNQKQTVKRIFRQLKGYIPLIILSLLMAVITVAGNIIVPIFFGEAINLIAEGGSDIAGILRYFAVTGALIAVTCLSQWLMNVINNKITFSVTEDIRKEAFEHIQRLPLRYLDAHPYGDIVSRNIADVDQFADGLLMGFTQFFTGVLTIISVLVMMFVLNWIIALAVFVLTPLSLFIAKFISTRTYRLFRTNSQIRGEQTAFIDEMVGNLKVVQAFSHEGVSRRDLLLVAAQSYDEVRKLACIRRGCACGRAHHYLPVGSARRLQRGQADHAFKLRQPIHQAVQRNYGRNNRTAKRHCVRGQNLRTYRRTRPDSR